MELNMGKLEGAKKKEGIVGESVYNEVIYLSRGILVRGECL